MSIFHFLDHLDEIEKLLYQLPKPSYICFCLNYLVFKQKNKYLPWLETAWSGWILLINLHRVQIFLFSVFFCGIFVFSKSFVWLSSNWYFYHFSSEFHEHHFFVFGWFCRHFYRFACLIVRYIWFFIKFMLV